jgi:hypothetical protein
MEDFIREAHSGWRYVVIVATFALALYFAYLLAAKPAAHKRERIALAAWGGILDIQLTLGLVLLALYLGNDKYYGALMGHWTLGIMAALVGHIPAFYKRLNGEPTVTARRVMGLALPILVFLLVLGGLAAINRPLFGS